MQLKILLTLVTYPITARRTLQRQAAPPPTSIPIISSISEIHIHSNSPNVFILLKVASGRFHFPHFLAYELRQVTGYKLKIHSHIFIRMNTQSSQMNKLMYSFGSQMNKLMYSFGKLMYSFQPIDDFKISVLLYSRPKNSKWKIFKMAAFYMILLLIFVILSIIKCLICI